MDLLRASASSGAGTLAAKDAAYCTSCSCGKRPCRGLPVPRRHELDGQRNFSSIRVSPVLCRKSLRVGPASGRRFRAGAYLRMASRIGIRRSRHFLAVAAAQLSAMISRRRVYRLRCQAHVSGAASPAPCHEPPDSLASSSGSNRFRTMAITAAGSSPEVSRIFAVSGIC